jgi:hypothetical protein
MSGEEEARNQQTPIAEVREAVKRFAATEGEIGRAHV